MRAVVQRVREASVSVNDEMVSRIAVGLLVLVGVEEGDTEKDALYLADKTAGLRVFEDDQGKMNLDITSLGNTDVGNADVGNAGVGGSVLAVSQFTLLGDVRKGKRPSFISAARPTQANELFEVYCQRLRELQIPVEQGVFQADMQVALVNDGPVTILLDSRKQF